MLRRLRHWFRRPTIDDPVLGPLEHIGQSLWTRTTPLDLHGDPVHLHVFAPPPGPVPGPLDVQRRLFTDLLTRYPLLRNDIEQPLFAAYQSIRVPADPTLEHPSDIWRIAHLSIVEIQGYNGVDVGLLYEIDWTDPEHVLSAQIRDWKVLDVGLEG